MVTFKKYNLDFATVRETDAAFIYRLRTDPSLAKHLSKTDGDIEDQKSWITKYKFREEQGTEYYFLTSLNGEPQGLNRLYNFQPDAFEIGSWLFVPGCKAEVPILADLAVRDYGFENLKFPYCTFEVRKENKSVVRYHKQFKPAITGEDDLNLYFKLGYEQYLTQRDKLLKILL